MTGNEHLIMDDSGNIPEEEFTPEMNAAVEAYMQELHENNSR